MLPGGRWIIGTALIGGYLELLCWDRLAPSKAGTFPHVARIQSRGPSFEMDVEYGAKLMTQWDSSDNCVNILLSHYESGQWEYEPGAFEDSWVIYTFCSERLS